MAAQPVADPRNLRDLASDLTGIAARVSAIADCPHLLLDRGGFTASQIQTLIEARHRRSAALGLDLVHAGWSIMLVLFRAHLEGRPVRMARLATDAHVAMATMTRWMARFLDQGLAERRPAPTHARGVQFALSADGAERIRLLLLAEKW